MIYHSIVTYSVACYSEDCCHCWFCRKHAAAAYALYVRAPRGTERGILGHTLKVVVMISILIIIIIIIRRRRRRRIITMIIHIIMIISPPLNNKPP